VAAVVGFLCAICTRHQADARGLFEHGRGSVGKVSDVDAAVPLCMAVHVHVVVVRHGHDGPCRTGCDDWRVDSGLRRAVARWWGGEVESNSVRSSCGRKASDFGNVRFGLVGCGEVWLGVGWWCE
jgi:hypothetical protein